LLAREVSGLVAPECPVSEERRLGEREPEGRAVVTAVVVCKCEAAR
jgi:hypothetical protein